MKFVILVSGKRFVGKDTFFDLLQKIILHQNIDLTIEKFAAADECKKLFAEKNNLDYEKLKNDRDYKEFHRQNLTDFFWQNDLIVFEKSVADAIDRSSADICIVTDFRFESQRQHIVLCKNVAIFAVRINCDDETRRRRGWIYDEKKDNDATENSLDCFAFFDKIIDNNGSLENFKEKIKEFLENCEFFDNNNNKLSRK